MKGTGLKNPIINSEGRATLLLVSSFLFVVNVVLFLTPAYGWWSFAVLAVSVFILLFLLYFFRNPQRRFPSDDTEKVVVSPADGTVVAIEEVDEPDYFMDRRIVISIFMSVYSVHANWFPVNGTVKEASHQPGNFHAAFKPKASTENERSLIVIETTDGHEVMLRQIAGAVARRVVTYCKPGDESRIDSHLGFIKFGSRVDVYLPIDSLVCVKLNQKVTGDQTILAKLS
ncbi:MAG: phosphatidylserine decarboxylase family protein [Bacteroidaceae bacterium]|nr:phosphatidylserine decarboxylase family protein [Bacteroidaceae bacterium]